MQISKKTWFTQNVHDTCSLTVADAYRTNLHQDTTWHFFDDSNRSKRTKRGINSLSIKRFWGKGERWKPKKERAEGEKLPFSSPPPPSPISNLLSPSHLGRPDTQAKELKANATYDVPKHEPIREQLWKVLTGDDRGQERQSRLTQFHWWKAAKLANQKRVYNVNLCCRLSFLVIFGFRTFLLKSLLKL